MELLVVDDANNPVVLHFRAPESHFQIKILKISYPEEKKIEKSLRKPGRRKSMVSTSISIARTSARNPSRC